MSKINDNVYLCYITVLVERKCFKIHGVNVSAHKELKNGEKHTKNNKKHNKQKKQVNMGSQTHQSQTTDQPTAY